MKDNQTFPEGWQDCHICHHDPKLSSLCSRCGPECDECFEMLQ